MSILGTDAYRFALASRLREARTGVSLVSAFITVPGIEWILRHLPSSLSSFRVLSRWNCWDLVTGASDLEVYPMLSARGASFYLLPDLHAKTVLIDETVLLLGSANITNSGLRLVPGGNREMGISITPTAEDIRVVDTMFDEAVELSPDLFQEFREQLEQMRKVGSPDSRSTWSAEFSKKLVRRPERLWVAELVWTERPSKLTESDLTQTERVARQHDLALLGFDEDSSILETDLKEAFLRCRSCQWLMAKLEERDAHELYFGELTALLHDALLDDPKPYRKDVKTLALGLINWTEVINRPLVSIDRPKHSQRVRLHLP